MSCDKDLKTSKFRLRSSRLFFLSIVNLVVHTKYRQGAICVEVKPEVARSWIYFTTPPFLNLFYHATSTSQEWFKSYLSNRTQHCCIHGSLSDSLVLARGVPQGSILGPILFSLYINDLPIEISNSNVDIYADDTTIWEINSDPLRCLFSAVFKTAIDRTSRWQSPNKMVPNTNKTKYLIIGTVQKLLHSGNPSLDLSLCGTPIEEAKDE